jgi:hypothetical protein
VFFFTDEPFRIVGTKFTCEMFWGDVEQLKEKTDGERGTGEDNNGNPKTEN